MDMEETHAEVEAMGPGMKPVYGSSGVRAGGSICAGGEYRSSKGSLEGHVFAGSRPMSEGPATLLFKGNPACRLISRSSFLRRFLAFFVSGLKVNDG